MTFQDMHELLRLELNRRIDRGTLTGTLLARQTGFQQAHISNFLNRKRALSLDGLDRVLAAQNLSVEHFLPLEIEAAAPAPLSEQIPVIPPSVAANHARITSAVTIETLTIAASRLHSYPANPIKSRIPWQRFVAVRLDSTQAAPMQPFLTPNALVIIDRHHTSLAPVHSTKPNIFAVQHGDGLVFRYVQAEEKALILRPHDSNANIHRIVFNRHETAADFIVGRACLTLADL